MLGPPVQHGPQIHQRIRARQLVLLYLAGHRQAIADLFIQLLFQTLATTMYMPLDAAFTPILTPFARRTTAQIVSVRSFRISAVAQITVGFKVFPQRLQRSFRPSLQQLNQP
jgi:hypothetical protein